MKDCNTQIQDFKKLQVPDDYEKQKKEQLSAFTDSTNLLIKKLKDIGTKIQDKQKMHADLAIQSAQASMVSVSEHDRMTGQDEFMTHGVTEQIQQNEEQKAQAQIQLNIKNESDFVQNVIDQRKDDINTIATLMSNINMIAKDIAVETSAQGEKLEKLDENITVADENASNALKEL